MAAVAQVGEGPLFLLDYLLRFGRVAVLLTVWRMILDGRETVAGLTIGAVLSYTLIAEVFTDPLTCHTELAWSLFEGSIGPRFLWPMGLVAQFGAEAFGRWWLGFAFCSIPLLVLAPALGVNPAPAGLAAGGAFALSLILAVTVGLALEFIFAAVVADLEQNVYMLDRVRGGLTALLSGATLPLAVYPWGLGEAFGYLPFAAMASAPLRIYTGTGNPLTLLLVQAGWAVVLWPVAQWLWRTKRQKLVTYGG